MSLVSHAYKVLDDLDLSVLDDIEDSRDEPLRHVFYVGWPQKLDAGIRGQQVSPCFSTQEELIDWVNANEPMLRQK